MSCFVPCRSMKLSRMSRGWQSRRPVLGMSSARWCSGGEWTPEFGDAEFSVYIRRGLFEAGDYSCGIGYRSERKESLMLARYDGGGHEHREIVDRPHIHWLTADSLSSTSIPELEAAVTDRFDTLGGAVYCLIEDFDLSYIHIPPHIRRMFQWH